MKQHLADIDHKISPLLPNYRDKTWTVIRNKYDEIIVVELKDAWSEVELTKSVPWALEIAKIKIPWALRTAEAFRPILEQRFMDAGLIALAPRLLKENDDLKIQIKTLKLYINSLLQEKIKPVPYSVYGNVYLSNEPINPGKFIKFGD